MTTTTERSCEKMATLRHSEKTKHQVRTDMITMTVTAIQAILTKVMVATTVLAPVQHANRLRRAMGDSSTIKNRSRRVAGAKRTLQAIWSTEAQLRGAPIVPSATL